VADFKDFRSNVARLRRQAALAARVKKIEDEIELGSEGHGFAESAAYPPSPQNQAAARHFSFSAPAENEKWRERRGSNP